MHPEIATALARHHAAELHATAELRRRRRPERGNHTAERRGHRPSLRTRTGWLLVRWGHRLAPPPRIASASSRTATMGS